MLNYILNAAYKKGYMKSGKLMNGNLFFALLASWFLIGNHSSAAVYKCIDSDGSVMYQADVCPEGSNSTEMKIRKHPIVPSIQPEAKLNKKPEKKILNLKISKKLKQQSKNTRCSVLLKSYAQLKEQAKKRCRQEKNTYCDLPGDQIEERNYKRDLAFSYRDGRFSTVAGVNVINSRSMLGKLRRPALLQLKDKLKSMKCL